MTSTMSNNDLIAAILAKPDDDRKEIFLGLAEAMLIGGPLRPIATASATKGRAKKAKAEDDGEPKEKKPMNTYMAFTNQRVWPFIKELIESLPEEDQKEARKVSCRTQISSALYKPLAAEFKGEELSAALDGVTDEEITEAYEAWKADPPEAHCKADREAKRAGSVASSGTKASASTKSSGKKKLADMTADEKKAHYAAIAAKAKATKAAKKAAKEAEEKTAEDEEDEEEAAPAPAPKAKAATPKAATPAPTEELEELEDEKITVESYEWKHDFGKGVRTFTRIDYKGVAYIYTPTEEMDYLGAYDEAKNKLDKSVRDFQEGDAE